MDVYVWELVGKDEKWVGNTKIEFGCGNQVFGSLFSLSPT
jgi:hypothetical protein